MGELSVNRWTEDALLNVTEWVPSERLFGPLAMTDINDFESHHYNYFLDHVSSLNDLIAGLKELSPLADDALSVAERISQQDFLRFKRMLKKERKGISSKAPKEFRILLFPANFLKATLVAEEFEVCLGVALVRLMELAKSPPL